MKATQIPAFFDVVIKAGCDICAVGHFGYVFGDTVQHQDDREELDRIDEEFGDRSVGGHENNPQGRSRSIHDILAVIRSLGEF